MCSSTIIINVNSYPQNHPHVLQKRAKPHPPVKQGVTFTETRGCLLTGRRHDTLAIQAAPPASTLSGISLTTVRAYCVFGVRFLCSPTGALA